LRTNNTSAIYTNWSETFHATDSVKGERIIKGFKSRFAAQYLLDETAGNNRERYSGNQDRQRKLVQKANLMDFLLTSDYFFTGQFKRIPADLLMKLLEFIFGCSDSGKKKDRKEDLDDDGGGGGGGIAGALLV
jgi:hypothetical protein